MGDSIRGSSDSMSNGNNVSNVNGAVSISTASNGQNPPEATQGNSLTSTASNPSYTNKDHEHPQRKFPTEATRQQSSISGASQKNLAEKTPEKFVPLVHQVFGGKMQTSYQCSNCKSISLHKETFTDLHLALPEVKKEGTAEILTMQKLVDNYLKPETLQGENKYHCDHCNSLQDAVKTSKILQGPNYLMTTLMRFHYDRKFNRKSKVFTNIQYELDLTLPIFNEKDLDDMLESEDVDMEEEDKADPQDKSLSETKTSNPGEDAYSLYAVVVHSGYSSDGGHYYTYAREPSTDFDVENDSRWYIFNDSKVSFSSFESFKNISKRFPADTAYLLFYQKVAKNSSENAGNLPEVSTSGKLRRDLKMSVENDNIKFMREKERSSRSSTSGYQAGGTAHGGGPQPPPDDDLGGPRGCGGGGFNAPGRFVC